MASRGSLIALSRHKMILTAGIGKASICSPAQEVKLKKMATMKLNLPDLVVGNKLSYFIRKHCQ